MSRIEEDCEAPFTSDDTVVLGPNHYLSGNPSRFRTGPVRIEVCDAPHHLLLTMQPGSEGECELEAWLTEEGSKTRLVVEERGLPRDELYLHGAGWQAHLEHLGMSLTSGASAHPGGWSSSRRYLGAFRGSTHRVQNPRFRIA